MSKNCRKGEGTIKAVQQVQRMIDAHPTWWIGKFDFEGFFMSIDTQVLWEMVDEFIRTRYHKEDRDIVLWITSIIIFHRPQERCEFRSPASAWRDIPSRKTLFGQPEGKGCAIGNLPSQLLANFYASAFDDFVRRRGITEYVRFVDDFVILMPSRQDVVRIIPTFRHFLEEQLHLRLHPKKIYVQPARNGVLYVGAYIQPGRTYIGNRTRGRFINCLRHYNKIAENGQAFPHLEQFVSSINSYLGLMRHYKTYNIRHRMLKDLHRDWWQYITIDGHVDKVTIKKKFRKREQWRAAVKNGDYVRLLTPELC